VDDDFEVTLFDGALAVPFMTASVRSGDVEVQLMTAGMDGRTESDEGTFAVRLARLTGSSSPCRFPYTIEVIPHGTGDPRLFVRTVDGACTASRRGR
jgi:hypothetical protein